MGQHTRMLSNFVGSVWIAQHTQQRRSSFYQADSSMQDADETTPLITSSSAKEEGDCKQKKRLRAQPSLIKVLFKTFGMPLFLAQIWKLFYDALILTNPLVLG